MRIIWSALAEEQLDKIFDYYEINVSSDVASKIVIGIINEPNKLMNSPYIGQEEELLKHRNIKYRYLIHKNYKIIYSVDIQQNSIKIADVFDTRQNPQKLKRNK